MIYVLLGIIGLLVIIIVILGIWLYQNKDYVYTREEFHKRIKDIKKNHDEAVKDRNKVITSIQGELENKHDFLNNLIDEERRNSFKFETKYNVGDNIWYVKDSKTYQGKIKNITTQLFKSKDGIKATQYNYLLECGTNAKESEIICVH